MSCSHLLPIKEAESISDYYARINSECEGEDVTITLLDGTEHSGNTIQITAKETTWFDDKQNDIIKIRTDEIKTISYTNNTTGAGSGAIIGGGLFFLVGAAITLLGGPISLGARGQTNQLNSTVLIGFLSSIPGLLLGAIVGTAIGSETTFEIN